MLAGGTALPDVGSALQEQIAANLLPGAGDSRVVDGGEGR
jgi:hypothetical protein